MKVSISFYIIAYVIKFLFLLMSNILLKGFGDTSEISNLKATELEHKISQYSIQCYSCNASPYFSSWKFLTLSNF